MCHHVEGSVEARGKDSPSSPQKDGVNHRREINPGWQLPRGPRARVHGGPRQLSCQPAVTSISVGVAHGDSLHFSGRPGLPPPGSHLGRCKGRLPSWTRREEARSPHTLKSTRSQGPGLRCRTVDSNTTSCLVTTPECGSFLTPDASPVGASTGF